MNSKDTIAAISTPMGVGAIGVVRLSGKDALSITQRLTQKKEFLPRYATLCHVYDEGEVVDEVIVLYFQAPHSYTCEDVCEIQCHGGVVLAREILRLCLVNGARMATEGEFTKRAFLHGRIDFSQVQAIGNLIQAQSLQASKMMSRQLMGSLRDFVEQSRESLLRALAFSETMIDYSDEDIPEDALEELGRDISSLQKQLVQILEFSKMRSKILEGHVLCIVGKPNVGKSSLLNAILMQERAIVSNVAGTTRDTIEEVIFIDGHLVRIIDTAGIREGGDEIESIGMQRSLRAIEKSDIVLVVFDASRRLDEEDLQIIAHLDALPRKQVFAICNKNDLAPLLDVELLKGKLKGVEFFSMQTQSVGDILELKARIGQKILQEMPAQENILLTADYQIDCVTKAIATLEMAEKHLQTLELELFSYHLNDAIEQISLLTKPYNIEEMFDRMFSIFCLGK
ncbi:thiophene and furan oxidation protein [Helicobacter mustelae]|uniref:tRNA uridine-5-carboxymethylaminomethyl(34) synthesis GTPase MnmE n=1 Tax=Helicobacter mustelae TaxID=217 RepID=UPI000E03D1A2|nr:tRNA uridine-5-carboxymethylaminomethyl(34) synthesis GTPase MnmE [Helicobacter mustelae]STP12828.1 thiophene and furan oxidation protein [Helicobacter mustelae]